MPITATCRCGKSFTLKDEFAHTAIRCPSCGGTFTVGASERVAQADPLFERDKFLIRQRHFAISSKYDIADDEGREIAFAHRPSAVLRLLLAGIVLMIWLPFAFFVVPLLLTVDPSKPSDLVLLLVYLLFLALGFGIFYLLLPLRHTTFYRTDEMLESLMTVRQLRKFSVRNMSYHLFDSDGTVLAELRKNYLYNIIRKRWYISDPAGQLICVAIEDSILLSLLRRFLGPMLGMLRTNFMIVKPDFEQELGEFVRKFTLFDKYVLDLTQDPNRTLDRRIALALGVMLDTGENR